jgi:hypothetical protein
MKKQIMKLVALALVAGSLSLTQNSAAQTRVSIGIFYSSLAPYGEWIDYRGYGLCWRPTVVGVGWRPYTNGYWVWTDYGWTWVSYYEWGWAPFHYGRWLYDDFYGWIWVPDDVWGPAWVQWRYSDAYIGWAPLPPTATFQVGIGISFVEYRVPHYAWSFTYSSGFVGSRIVYVPVKQNIVILRQTRLIPGVTHRGARIYNNGPRVEVVERAAGRKVQRLSVLEDRDAGSGRGFEAGRRERVEGNRLFIYRPDIGRGTHQGPESRQQPGGGIERRERARPEGQIEQRPRENEPRGQPRILKEKERRDQGGSRRENQEDRTGGRRGGSEQGGRGGGHSRSR